MSDELGTFRRGRYLFQMTAEDAARQGLAPTGKQLPPAENKMRGDVPTDKATRPPLTGAGSGKAAWRAHAAALGVDVPDDATRDDIVARIDATP